MSSWKLPSAVLACMFAAAATATAEPVDLTRLGWLEGRWTGEARGAITEEIWTSPAGGALIGMHKDVRQGRQVSFEFLRIVTVGDSVCYLASPGGRPPTPFCLREIGERRVVFENPAHDFPQRVLYWLDDQGRLHARVEGMVGGKAEGEEWVWTAAPDRLDPREQEPAAPDRAR